MKYILRIYYYKTTSDIHGRYIICANRYCMQNSATAIETLAPFMGILFFDSEILARSLLTREKWIPCSTAPLLTNLYIFHFEEVISFTRAEGVYVKNFYAVECHYNGTRQNMAKSPYILLLTGECRDYTMTPWHENAFFSICQWRGALMFSLICALNKRLSKQSWDWWFDTPSRSVWRHCNGKLSQQFQ